MQKQEIEDIKTFVNKYYKLLDSNASAEKVLDFYTEDFIYIDGSTRIESSSRFIFLYNLMSDYYVKRTHSIKSINIKQNKKSYSILINIDFRGFKSSKEEFKSNGLNIHWDL